MRNFTYIIFSYLLKLMQGLFSYVVKILTPKCQYFVALYISMYNTLPLMDCSLPLFLITIYLPEWLCLLF